MLASAGGESALICRFHLRPPFYNLSTRFDLRLPASGRGSRPSDQRDPTVIGTHNDSSQMREPSSDTRPKWTHYLIPDQPVVGRCWPRLHVASRRAGGELEHLMILSLCFHPVCNLSGLFWLIVCRNVNITSVILLTGLI